MGILPLTKEYSFSSREHFVEGVPLPLDPSQKRFISTAQCSIERNRFRTGPWFPRSGSYGTDMAMGLLCDAAPYERIPSTNKMIFRARVVQLFDWIFAGFSEQIMWSSLEPRQWFDNYIFIWGGLALPSYGHVCAIDPCPWKVGAPFP